MVERSDTEDEALLKPVTTLRVESTYEGPLFLIERPRVRVIPNGSSAVLPNPPCTTFGMGTEFESALTGQPDLGPESGLRWDTFYLLFGHRRHEFFHAGVVLRLQ